MDAIAPCMHACVDDDNVVVDMAFVGVDWLLLLVVGADVGGGVVRGRSRHYFSVGKRSCSL